MRYIEIAALDNGAHRNQTVDGAWLKIPEGWAVIPDDMETPNFPFGEVKTKKINGVLTVTSWTAGDLPEEPDGPEAEPEPTMAEQITDLQAMAVEADYRLTLLELGV
jgi:hypothetical protein